MKFARSEVNFGYVQVRQLDHLSGVIFGTTVRVGNYNSAKKTQGFGIEYSDGSSVILKISEVNDADGIDSLSANRISRVIRF